MLVSTNAKSGDTSHTPIVTPTTPTIKMVLQSKLKNREDTSSDTERTDVLKAVLDDSGFNQILISFHLNKICGRTWL